MIGSWGGGREDSRLHQRLAGFQGLHGVGGLGVVEGEGSLFQQGIKGSEGLHGMAGSWGSGRMILSTLSEIGRIS